MSTLRIQVLQAMPEEAANGMVAGLLQRRRMSAGLLALFAQQLSCLRLEAVACWGRPADWLLSVGKCRWGLCTLSEAAPFLCSAATGQVCFALDSQAAH